MNKLNWILSLFILIVGQNLTQAKVRPNEVATSILREGCFPFVDFQCPAKMLCYVDINYKKFGQCHCRLGHSMRMLPPTPSEPGSELAKLPHKSDCVPIGLINVPVAISYVFITAVHMLMLVGSTLMLRSVIKKGGFKPNSSCLALIGLIVASLGAGLRTIMYLLVRLNLDPDWFIFDNWFNTLQSIDDFATIFVNMESACTWFDLWQKSVTMSKRSSNLITAFRYFLRTLTFALMVLVSGVYGGWFPGGGLGSPLNLLINDVAMYSVLACNILFAPLLARLLCKDMRDVKNPNWKAASAIRITGCYGTITALSLNLSFRFFTFYGIYALQARFMTQTAFINMSLCQCINQWAWYQYLQFAHRRYLGDAPLSRISNYFGFTTIGLKGSRASSLASGKSSAASSVASSASSSVASSASIAATSSVEAEGADGKGTMT